MLVLAPGLALKERGAFARPRPPEVGPADKWVHVDLREQVLVAYEGDRPVFATLVSAGNASYSAKERSALAGQLQSLRGQLLLLAKSYGIAQGEEIRIGLALAQEDLAQLLGASRQRVNQELKGFEREGAVRVEPTRLVVLSREKLMAAADR